MDPLVLDLTQIIIDGEKVEEAPIQFAFDYMAYARPRTLIVGQDLKTMQRLKVTTVALKDGHTNFSVKEPISEWGKHIYEFLKVK
jgi:hypothetical protein